MDQRRWQQAEKLYHEALEREPRNRRAFLAAACSDETLRREVESLLAEDSTIGLLADPAWQAGAPLLADRPGSSPETTSALGPWWRDDSRRVRFWREDRVAAPLGRGGMGEVYRATDVKLEQTVALKFLPEPTANDPSAVNRLYNEVRLARQISHPNVCRVLRRGGS